VPIDVEAARAAELAGVFAHVDRLESDLRAREQEGEREAEAILADAGLQAGRIAADGNERAATARAEAAAGRRREFEEHAHELARQAAYEAEEVRRRAREAFPALIDEAVARVREFAAGRGDETAGSGRT
jgi:vacuolar-type H+-ATPase subunit E/Vma4